MSFIRFYEGFVARGSTPMGSIVYFGELGTSLWVAQLAVYAVGRVLMDALLVRPKLHGHKITTAHAFASGRSPVCILELKILDYRPSNHHCNWRPWCVRRIEPIIIQPTNAFIPVASAMNCYYATQFAGFESKAFILQSQWITAAYSFSCL